MMRGHAVGRTDKGPMKMQLYDDGRDGSQAGTGFDRRQRMALLAQAAAADLARLMPPLPRYEVLRAPEIGAVMVQGRIGGTGAAFNLGEMTVTRASVALAGQGAIGHAMVQGRNRDHALHAAVIDAMAQSDAAAAAVDQLLRNLAQTAEERRLARAAKAAATRVEFFTLVRGEDE